LRYVMRTVQLVELGARAPTSRSGGPSARVELPGRRSSDRAETPPLVRDNLDGPMRTAVAWTSAEI